jgi:hypothetical protein
MSNIIVQNLLERRKQLTEELAKHPGLLQGTWVERFTVCARKTCKCHAGEKHGPRYHLAVMENGKQRQHYIRREHKELALRGLAHNRIIEETLQEITKINLELMKEGAYDDD